MYYWVRYTDGKCYPVSYSKLEWQAKALISFARSYEYYRYLEDSNFLSEPNKNGKIQIYNTIFLSCIIEWNKVFGAKNNKTTWKNVFYKPNFSGENLVTTKDQYVRRVQQIILS